MAAAIGTGLQMAQNIRLVASEVKKMLSSFPGVSLSGDWFIEEHSEIMKLDDKESVIGFIRSHWFEFTILNASIFATVLRIGYLFSEKPKIGSESYLNTSVTGIAFILTPVVPPE